MSTQKIAAALQGIFDEDGLLIGYHSPIDGKERFDLSGIAGGFSTAGVLSSATSLDLTGAHGESLKIKQATELMTIAAAASSDSVADLLPAGAIILAVATRVTVAIPTATNFDVGDSGDADRYAVDVLVAIDTTDKGALLGAYYNAAAAKVKITPDATPGTAVGRVRVTVFYIEVTPPTS